MWEKPTYYIVCVVYLLSSSSSKVALIPTGSGIKKRRRQPLVESTQEVIRNLRHKQVLQGLAEYSIEVHGEVLRSYYSDREPIQRNESLAASSAAEVMMKAIKRHEIPSSFCIDPDNQKLLLCPRVELNKRTTVYKCCPFGKQLKDPLFSGITPIPSHLSLLDFAIENRISSSAFCGCIDGLE